MPESVYRVHHVHVPESVYRVHHEMKLLILLIPFKLKKKFKFIL